MMLKSFVSLSIFASFAVGKEFRLSEIKHFFSFGDSYTDTGFNPNGTLAGPAVSNPLGNPVFPGFTSSGGENWVGFLIDTFNVTKVFSYNFAFSGATLDSSLATPFSPTVVSVKNQIQQEFIPGLGQKPVSVPWTAENSLFAIFDGINDVLNIDGNPNQTAAQEPFFTLYTTLVDQLFEVGARNFLFVGVPAIDLTPFVIEQGPDNPALAKTSLELWNKNVQIVAANLKRAHPDVTTHFANMESLFRELVAHPQIIGLQNSSEIWFNTLHPVAAVHKAMARTIADVLLFP